MIRNLPTLLLSSLFTALPFGFRRDVLYLWATFRLRRKPLKIMAWVGLLGVVCWALNYAGNRWAMPQLQKWAGMLDAVHLRNLTLQVTGALFSSLNILSCLSLTVIWMTLRRLNQEGHIESLQLTPNQFSPSSLYYAIASRYVPLVLIAILIEFIHPTRSPFKRDLPFRFYDQLESQLWIQDYISAPTILQWTIYWAAAYLISLCFFCLANLFMDLAVAFWRFVRFRLSFGALVIANLFVGLGTPFILMEFRHRVSLEQRDLVFKAQEIVESYIAGRPLPAITMHSQQHVMEMIHYGAAGLISAIVGWLLLAHLNFRWRRITSSTDRDAVLLRVR